MVEIRDEDSVRAWLETQDHQTQVWFAARCALRALPGLGTWPAGISDGLVFEVCKAALVAAAAATCPVAQIDKLTKAAASASGNIDSTHRYPTSGFKAVVFRSATRSAFEAALTVCAVAGNQVYSANVDHAALAAARAASSAGRLSFLVDHDEPANTAAEFQRHAYSAATRDANTPKTWDKLWPDGTLHAEFQGAWKTLKSLWQADGPHWSFWITWYEAVLEGEWTNWDLIFRIATEVTEDQWDAGPAVVAERIREIRLNWRTEVSRRLEFDPTTETFSPELAESIPQDVENFVLARVKNALSSALQAGGTNGFTETSFEAVHLHTVLSKEKPEASILATTCWDACMSLNKNIGDLYPEDASLIVLKNTLFTGVDELCETSQIIKARIAKLAALETSAYPTDSEKKQLKVLPEELAPELSEEAKGIYESDIEIILSNQKPPRSVRARVTNWTTTILAWMDRAKKGDARLKWLTDVANRMAKWWSDTDM